MQCEICKQEQAVVVIHLQLPERGVTIFACRKCSETVLKLSDLAPTQEALEPIESAPDLSATHRAKKLVCPTCGFVLKVEDEVDAWQLGCPDCYRALDDEARGRLVANQGGHSHLGRSGGCNHPASVLPELLLDYQLALAGEDYERAAGLFERIKASTPEGSA